MRHIDYATSAPGLMSNTVKLASANVDFDYETDAQVDKSYINGGRFTYTDETDEVGQLASTESYLYDDGAEFKLDRD